MRDRSEQILRMACLALAALVALQLVRAGFQVTRLAGAKIPAVPTLNTNSNLTADSASELKMQKTNLAATATQIKPALPTNLVAAQKGSGTNLISTNSEAIQKAGGLNPASTNSELAPKTGGTNSVSTNSVAAQIAHGTNSASTNSEAAQTTPGTNSIMTNSELAPATDETSPVPTNSGVAEETAGAASTSTNSSAAPLTSGTNPASTNSEAAPIAVGTNSISTNAAAQIAAGTNSFSTNSETAQIAGKTNPLSARVAAPMATNGNPVAGTNSVAAGTTNSSRKPLPPSTARMPGMPGQPGSAPKLPPEVQARVDKIVSSEIFAPVMHPLPMGLLGIAGDTAFLRTASGQTGLVKPGDSLGDLKLLQIGINRVLVEQDGQKKELTIFNGYGGGSLLTNQDDTKNENIQLQKRAGPPGTN